MFEGNPIHSTYLYDYLLIIIVACTFIVLRAFYLNPKVFSRILHSPFNLNESKKLLHDTNIIISRTSFFLNIVFVISFSIFCYLTLSVFEVDLLTDMNISNHMVFLAMIFGVLLLFYLSRHMLYTLVGYVSNHISLQHHYIQIWMNLNKWFGLILLPMLLALMYFPDHIKPYIIYIFAVVFGFQFVFKLIQGFKISAGKRVSLLVIFLYLCTLELLPVSVVIKYMTGII
ncbi:MAG: DUF4271 domain-containing protein [Candidatus Delongbacteria bacterium]|jgi:hypothetical protein|nr:DUF4271 domain-containing protein [Candidatus Delongbacteria bacterium]